jgi:hypothetical protein
MSKNTPGAPTKAPPKIILPSSRFYPDNNNENLNNEDLETVEEMSENNLQRLVKETLNSPGNTKNPRYSPSILNTKVPKMKLPAPMPSQTRGGKRKTRKHKTRRMKKRTYKQKRRA